MPNKSLDFYLFDFKEKKVLNWKRRFCIIEGIAQGLVYLHHFSRLTVVHRDLKASNVLLDDEMRPKISDFWHRPEFLSRKKMKKRPIELLEHLVICLQNTAMSGIVSNKTDVFSYGVLLLEIVTGKKNNNCYQTEGPMNLIGYAWQLWIEGRASELIDPIYDGSCSPSAVLKMYSYWSVVCTRKSNR
ncbi:putative Receptor protein kinase [Quillaja saponaria]|uniref:non-specific serine/threonine protein kinase n=1 Tax=Quillaja saponaria TaxID=32244 RepID=A0AAD7LRH7_QUISA|nr:putative Receptor protein kinase [Quillaja saponaria]